MRWSEVAPRAWNLGPLVAGTLTVDPEGLRAALDALLENAVKYTEVARHDRAEVTRLCRQTSSSRSQTPAKVCPGRHSRRSSSASLGRTPRARAQRGRRPRPRDRRRDRESARRPLHGEELAKWCNVRTTLAAFRTSVGERAATLTELLARGPVLSRRS